MGERIEEYKADHLDECAHLFTTAFNAEPWNDSYTMETAKKQLAWHLRVPGCLGLVSLKGGVVAFAVGYVEPTDTGDVYHLSIFCVRPDEQRTRIGTRLLAAPGRAPAPDRGQDRLPRDPQGNTRRSLLREARLRGKCRRHRDEP
jgi:GNAT superfamily N-acetyltransferase